MSKFRRLRGKVSKANPKQEPAHELNNPFPLLTTKKDVSPK